MTTEKTEHPDFQQQIYDLADACLHGELDDEQNDRLEALVAGNKEAGLLYVRYIYDCVDLQRWASARPKNKQPESKAPLVGSVIYPAEAEEPVAISSGNAFSFFGRTMNQVGDFISKPTSLSIAMAFIVMVSILATLALMSPNENPVPLVDNDPAQSTVQKQYVAEITGIQNCQWEENYVKRLSYEPLKIGEEIAFKKGLMKITFHSGASVILQGPIHFRIESQNSAYMSSGKSTFFVPQPARGFTLNTAAAQIVDIGTEFGVVVENSGDTELHVLKGVVKARSLATGDKEIKWDWVTEEQSIRFEVNSEKVLPNKFSPREFEREFFDNNPTKNVYLTKSTPSKRNWNEEEFWSSGQTPSTSKHYHVGRDISGKHIAGLVLRVANDDTTPFAGRSLTIHRGAILRTKEFSYVRDLRLAGGSLTHGGSKVSQQHHMIGGVNSIIRVNADSIIDIAPGEPRILEIRSQLTGDHTLKVIHRIREKNGGSKGRLNYKDFSQACVRLTNHSNNFYGDWVILNGRVHASAPGSLGAGNVTVKHLGLLDFGCDHRSPKATLTIADGGRLILDQHITFGKVVISDQVLSPGRHEYAELKKQFGKKIIGQEIGSITVVGEERSN